MKWKNIMQQTLAQRIRNMSNASTKQGVFSPNFNKSSLNNIELWKPTEEGEYNFDILPFYITNPRHPLFMNDNNESTCEVGTDIAYSRKYSVHSINGTNYTCPRFVQKDRCPICKWSYENKEVTDTSAYRAQEYAVFLIRLNADGILVDNTRVVLFFAKSFLFNHLLETNISNRNKQIKTILSKKPNTVIDANAYSEYTFSDLAKGCTLSVQFTKKTVPTNPKIKPFLCATQISYMPRTNPITQDVIDIIESIDIDSAITPPPSIGVLESLIPTEEIDIPEAMPVSRYSLQNSQNTISPTTTNQVSLQAPTFKPAVQAQAIPASAPIVQAYIPKQAIVKQEPFNIGAIVNNNEDDSDNIPF